MEFGELKPLLKALLLPPAGPMLLTLAGIAIGLRRRVAGAIVAVAGVVSLWLLSCNFVAAALAAHLLPGVVPAAESELATVQAIVLLGGGLNPDAPEYGYAQPASSSALARMRYAALLARRTGKPIALSSGVGWGGGASAITEAESFRRALQDDYGLAPRWIEDRSRDTRENARFSAALLRPQGIRRIALVTDAIHMPRAARNFREAGFEVVPAPTNFPPHDLGFADRWLPTAASLRLTWYVLHEWLGLQLT